MKHITHCIPEIVIAKSMKKDQSIVDLMKRNDERTNLFSNAGYNAKLHKNA